ncbi:hypothetical protein ACLOJK_038333 [Asimina triloba]
MTCTFPPKRRRCATRSSATAVAAAADADADAFLPSSYHLSFAISGPIDPTPEKAPKLALEGEAEEEEEDARADCRFYFFFCCCLCSLSVSFSPSARRWICFFCPLGWILVSRCLGPHPFGKRPPSPSLVGLVFLPAIDLGPLLVCPLALASLRLVAGPTF